MVAAGIALAFAAPAAPAAADSVRDRQWHLDQLRIAEAHKVTEGAGVVVGLVDTGVSAKHRDLAGAILPGLDTFPGAEGDGRKDVDGHGTEMAGLIAGRGHGSDSGVLGVASAAKILPIRAPTNTLTGPEPIAAAIDYAVDHGARVINMSFVSAGGDVLHAAIQRARAKDVVLVAGSGNKEEAGGGPFPAAYPEVLSVGATDRKGKIAAFSVTGPEVDVVAPGVDIATTGIGDSGYSLASGTSEATAIVSGVAALVRAKYPDLPAAEVVHRITATATDAGPKGRDDAYGYGRIDVLAALTADVPPAPVVGSAPSSAAAAPLSPGDDDSDPRAFARLVPLLLGFGAAGLVLIAGAVVLVAMVRRRRT